ncbi:3-octaprenyl-4-hydroxybenzoate carboxy-lyase [archaeon HR01]|nr:3-octaprenyl-4-hydroxybenzoate carboxy-lyase [archaeon HR01]
MSISSVRELLEELDKRGDVFRVKREVDPRSFQVPAIVRRVEEETGQAVYFERLKGYGMSLASNLYGSVSRCALALGIEPTAEEVARYRNDSRGSGAGMAGCTRYSFGMTDYERACVIKLRNAFEEGLKRASEFPVKTVSYSPIKEVILREDVDILKTIPVIWHCAEDAGPFFTSGIWITKDPDTGQYGMGIFRSQVTPESYGPNRAGVLFSVHSDTYGRLLRYESRGEPMEAAVVFASEPAVQLSAAFAAPKGVDEFELAGALKGSPVEMVKCETVDLLVPANAEIVVEGVVLPNVRMAEGPMAEFTDYYREEKAPKPVFEARAITFRRNPIYHTIMSGMSDEHRTLSAIVGWGWERRVLEKLRKEFPTVKAVANNLGSDLFHLVVSMRKEREGDDKRLLHYIMGLDISVFYKYVTIVDDDIDVYNPDQVEWARCMRAGTPDSYIIFHDMHTHNLDPMGRISGPPAQQRLTVTKLGILATHKVGERYRRPGPPDDVLEAVRLKDYS